SEPAARDDADSRGRRTPRPRPEGARIQGSLALAHRRRPARRPSSPLPGLGGCGGRIAGTTVAALRRRLPGVPRIAQLALRQLVEPTLLLAQQDELALAFGRVDLGLRAGVGCFSLPARRQLSRLTFAGF